MKKQSSLYLLLLGVFLLTGCRENYRAEKSYWEAEKILRQIKNTDLQAKGPEVLDPAIESFEKVIEKYPGTPKAAESLFMIADLRFRQKNHADAIHNLEKVILNFSSMPQKAAEARYRVFRLHEIGGDWEKAEAMAWELADYHPVDARGLTAPIGVIRHYKKLKNTAAEQKAFERAVEFYERSLKKVGPIQVAAAIQYYLGNAQLAHASLLEAKETWKSIHVQYPKSPFAPLALSSAAELAWQQRDFAVAVDLDQELLERYPTYSLGGKSAARLGLYYQRQKDYEKSRTWLTKALDYRSKERGAAAEIKMLIANTYQEEGRWEEANQIYQEIETQYAQSAAALQLPLILSAREEKVGNSEKAKVILEDAINHYKKLEEQYPHTKVAVFAEQLRLEAHLKKGEWDQVLANFDRHIDLEPSPARKGSWLYLKAVMVEDRLKDVRQALSLYDHFLLQYPNHPLTKFAKARRGLLVQTP